MSVGGVEYREKSIFLELYKRNLSVVRFLIFNSFLFKFYAVRISFT